MLLESHEIRACEENVLFPLDQREKSSTSPRDYSPAEEMYNDLVGNEKEDDDLRKMFPFSRNGSSTCDASSSFHSVSSCWDDEARDYGGPFFQSISRDLLFEKARQEQGLEQITEGLRIIKPDESTIDDFGDINDCVKDNNQKSDKSLQVYNIEPLTPPCLRKGGEGANERSIRSSHCVMTPQTATFRKTSPVDPSFQSVEMLNVSYLQFLKGVIARNRHEIVRLRDAKSKEGDFLSLTEELTPWLRKSYCSWDEGDHEPSNPPSKKKSKSQPKEVNKDTDGAIFAEICRDLFPKVFIQLKGKDASILLQKVTSSASEDNSPPPMFDSYKKIYTLASKMGKMRYNLRYTKRTPLITGIVQMFISASVILHSDNLLKYTTFGEFERKYHDILEKIKHDTQYLQAWNAHQFEEAGSYLRQEKLQLYEDANLKSLIMLILPPKDNKHWVIEDIVPRLLSFQKISLGSGKTPPTVRREKLFEQEHKEWSNTLLHLSHVHDERIHKKTSAKHNSRNIESMNLYDSLSSVAVDDKKSDPQTAASSADGNTRSDTRNSCTSIDAVSPTTIVDIEHVDKNELHAPHICNDVNWKHRPPVEGFVQKLTGSTRRYSVRSDGSDSLYSSVDTTGSLLEADLEVDSDGWSQACIDDGLSVLEPPKGPLSRPTVHDIDKENSCNPEFVRTISHGSTTSSVSSGSGDDFIENGDIYDTEQLDLELFAYI